MPQAADAAPAHVARPNPAELVAADGAICHTPIVMTVVVATDHFARRRTQRGRLRRHLRRHGERTDDGSRPTEVADRISALRGSPTVSPTAAHTNGYPMSDRWEGRTTTRRRRLSPTRSPLGARPAPASTATAPSRPRDSPVVVADDPHDARAAEGPVGATDGDIEFVGTVDGVEPGRAPCGRRVTITFSDSRSITAIGHDNSST
jgi:hypothetical protein